MAGHANLIDLTGRRFTRLRVIRRGPMKRGRTLWWCRCDCGTEKVINSIRLRNGQQTSCGCLLREQQHARSAKHSQSPLYDLWIQLMTRRRRSVCRRWWKFSTFLKDVGVRPSYPHQFRRTNWSVPYGPANWHWHKTAKIVVDGRAILLQEASNKLNVPTETLRGRIRLGWRKKDVVSTPLMTRQYRYGR